MAKLPHPGGCQQIVSDIRGRPSAIPLRHEGIDVPAKCYSQESDPARPQDGALELRHNPIVLGAMEKR